MADIDALAGLASAQSKTSNRPGTCLGEVYADYGSVQSIGPGAGQYGIAVAGWNFSADQHPGDTAAPAGVPVYFGVSPTRTDRNAAAGDVGISVGGGSGWFTDARGAGIPGVMTFEARAAQCRRPYLGWTGDFLGHNLVNYAVAVAPVADPSGEVRPQTQRGDNNGYVGYLQNRLKALGFDCGATDLQFGAHTFTAVEAFQSANNLVVDGIVGPNTWAALG